MQIKASTALRNEYPKISELAHASGEPVFITNKGEADLVVLSIEAFEEREKMLAHRAKYSEAEFPVSPALRRIPWIKSMRW